MPFGILRRADAAEVVAVATQRTSRSRAVTFAGFADALTRNDIRIHADKDTMTWPDATRLAAIDERPPAQALAQALRDIATRYGAHTADFVAMQLEYPRQQ
jgi:hypothetical protein